MASPQRGHLWSVVIGGFALVACGTEGGGSPALESSSGETSTGATDDPSTTSSTGDPADLGDGATGDSTGAPNLDPCVVGPMPAVAVGHGDAEFLPFDSGPASLVYGPQGGIHILVGIQSQNLDDSDLAVVRLRGVMGGELVGSSAPYAELECTPDGDAQEALGLLLVWDATPAMLHMQNVTVEVEVTDAGGVVVTTSDEVTIVDPQQN